jgi:hypothetical protein
MKLVIDTQRKENYAAYNEGYVHGLDAPYWAFKGGSTYIFPNCDPNKAEEIAEFVKAFITSNNEMFIEYVLDWTAQDDDFVTESQQMHIEHGQGDTNYLDPEIWIKDGRVFLKRGYRVSEHHATQANELHLWHDELFEGGDSKCVGHFVDGKERPRHLDKNAYMRYLAR